MQGIIPYSVSYWNSYELTSLPLNDTIISAEALSRISLRATGFNEIETIKSFTSGAFLTKQTAITTTRISHIGEK
jgi:hypothetical protein